MNFPASPEVLSQMDWLKEKLHASSNSDVIRQALNLLEEKLKSEPRRQGTKGGS